MYRIGDVHFVKDGHHRVSVAISTGQQMIDADVTEVLAKLPATGLSRQATLLAHDAARFRSTQAAT